MKKKVSAKKKTTKKKTTKKTVTPDYIVVNGVTYEKVSSDSVNVELDMGEDVLNQLDGLVNRGQYVSRGDAIRDILRQMLREKDVA